MLDTMLKIYLYIEIGKTIVRFLQGSTAIYKGGDDHSPPPRTYILFALFMTYEKIMIFYDETYDFAQGFLMRFQGHYLSYCLFSLRGAIILQGGAIMPPPRRKYC